MELLVGMSIMMIFLGIFTGAILILYQATNKANALTTSAAQTDNAFAHLDKTVRYAHALSTPGQNAAGTTWYVEFLSTGTGTSVCTQLRVTTAASGTGVAPQQLQVRTWTEPLVAGATAPAWTPWASGITNGTATPGSTSPPVPFTVTLPGSSNVLYQQLTVQLVSTSGSPAATAGVNATFTALNSDSGGAASAASCSTDWGRP